MQKYPSFHDWFLVGISIDADDKTVVVALRSDNKRDATRLVFGGVCRCLANGFAAQNIVYDLKILEGFDSAEYRTAVGELAEAHPWGRDWPQKRIAAITSSLGAEMLVEYETLRVINDQP